LSARTANLPVDGLGVTTAAARRRGRPHRSARRPAASRPELDADAVEARCLAVVLAQVRDHGWVHHIPRLMVLGNYGLQRGWSPRALTDWVHRCFVDGYDWVMLPNVLGMSQHADGGLMATKPYAAGGAYVNRMSDFCGDCSYRLDRRIGDDACPYTAGGPGPPAASDPAGRVGLEPTTDGLWELQTTPTTPSTCSLSVARAGHAVADVHAEPQFASHFASRLSCRVDTSGGR
jgi:hypothetical protein